MIPDDTVDRVREAADIVGVVGEYVPLRKMGADYRGPCPFHQGTHRNFSVSPRKRMYYCFVCHEGGDVFSFLQKRLGIDWPTAVKMVAEKSGIEVREVERKREGPDPRERFWEVNAAAADYFRRVLWEEDMGREAREYVASRRVTRELAERVGLGFAPREIGPMRVYLNTLGFEDARLLESGLLVLRDEGSEPRPRFRGRLMFPILDQMGRHVGFGGRLIGPGEPKYLNSGEGPAFSKGRLLYGLHWAKNAIRRDDRVLVVEGYFDVVRLLAAGVETAVAPLGTALTEDQAALLTRYSKNVFLLYDSDKAGLKATFRSGDELLRHGATVHVVSLPDGEDPDTFVDKHGAAKLEVQLRQSIDIFERKIVELQRAGWFASLSLRRKAIDKLLPTLRATTDRVTRDLYVARASEASGVGRELLYRELGLVADRGNAGDAAADQKAAPLEGSVEFDFVPEGRRRGDRRQGDRRRTPRFGAEHDLIRLLVNQPGYVEAVAERVSPNSFRDAEHRAIYQALMRLGESATPETIVELLGQTVAATVEALLAERDAIGDPNRVIADALGAFQVRALEQEQDELSAQMRLANSDEKDHLLKRKQVVQRQIQALGAKGASWLKKRDG